MRRGIFIWFGLAMSLGLFVTPSARAEFPLPIFLGREVVVTASRVPVSKWKTPQTTTVLFREDIVRLGAKTLSDALRFVPGVDVRGLGGLGANTTARIRGSAADQLLVLRNGVRFRTADTTIDMNDVLLSDVERIEIVRGPVSALYGPDAVGGVINILTYGAEEERVHATLDSGGFGSQNYSVTAGGLTDYGQFGLTFANTQTDGFRTNTGARAQTYHTTFQSADLFVPVKADVSFMSSEKGVPGSLAFPTPNNSQSDRVFHASAGMTVPYRSNASLQGDALLSQTERIYRDPAFGDNSTTNTRLLGGTMQNSWDLDDRNLIAGIDLRQERVTSTNYSGTQSTFGLGLFTQAIWPVMAGSLTTGVRLDSHSVYGDVINPRVAYSVPLSGDRSVRLSYGTAFKSPVFDQLFWSSAFYIGNPNLRPERSQSADVTWSQKFGEESDFSATLFTTQVRDRIINDFPLVGPGSPRNLAEANLSGWELELRLPVLHRAALTLNMTGQSAFDQTGAALLDIPSIKSNGSLDVKLGSTTVSIIARHVGERTDSFLRSTLPAFATLGLRFAGLGHPGLSLQLENLTNTEYQEAGGFPMPGARGSIAFKI